MTKRSVPGLIGRERTWKLVSWLSGAVGAFAARALIKAAYRALRRDDKAPSEVFDASKRRFSLPDALVWGVAGGLGLAIGKVVSSRLAALGWEAATGTAPPGSEEQAVG